MLDFDLAAMYGVKTGRLNEQVKRNIERFPEDFMFQLTKGEWEILKSQIVTSNSLDLHLITSGFLRLEYHTPAYPLLLLTPGDNGQRFVAGPESSENC